MAAILPALARKGGRRVVRQEDERHAAGEGDDHYGGTERKVQAVADCRQGRRLGSGDERPVPPSRAARPTMPVFPAILTRVFHRPRIWHRTSQRSSLSSAQT